MNRLICGFISILALTGCAQDYLATGLPMLKGQPVSQALDYLGPPAEKKKTAGETTYTWINHQTGDFYVPDTVASPVVVQSGGHATVAFPEPSMPPVPDTYDWHCRLDITAENGMIVRTDYQGNTGGCQVFSDKLKPLVTKSK